ncbi:endonuclease [Bacillus aerolatus]|uniref:Endonuclease n=1 Tax=Bacillus aerolatus TaxID=2653354 RepID=A0A6I1FGH3_9BACI|nr:DUF6359 domain-containing protein [Bacillus aerolatus]KAB7707347.1 endonuclease [Bacillus aerolatus]
MKKKNVGKLFNAALMFILLISLLSPLSASHSKAAEIHTVAQAMAQNSGQATVEGYIVGYTKSGPSYQFTGPFVDDTNIAIADSANEKDKSKIMPVQLKTPAGNRTTFGLKTNPENIGEKVQITGELGAYFGAPSFKKDTALTIEFVSSEDPGTNPEEPGEDPAEVVSIAEARAQETGTVTTKGVVTAKLKNTIHIQDETAAIAVRPASLDVQPGDEITVTGSLKQYQNLLQIDPAVLVNNEGNVGLPSPKQLAGSELNEENESKLATVKDVTIESAEQGSGWVNYTAADGTNFIVRDETAALNIAVGTTYDSITGIVQQFGEKYQIIPRGEADIVADATAVQSVFASPEEGLIAAGTKVTLETATEGADIFYTTTGEGPVQHGRLYQEPITVDRNMTVKVFAKKEGLTQTEVKEFQYKVFDPEEGLQIHDIQGDSHESPLKGEIVTNIEGIVTYTYKIGSGNYFHIQTPDDQIDDNPKTSEALIVYTGKATDTAIGDKVRISGKVDEYHIDGYNNSKRETDLSITQINARDDQGGKVEKAASGEKLPRPIVIGKNLPTKVIDNDSFKEFDPEEDAIDFWESIEGMRVEVGDMKAVAPQEHGDLIVVQKKAKTDTVNGGVRLTEDNQHPERIQFKLFPNNEARNFDVATGDLFNGTVAGVVNYGFQNYKIYADLADLQAAFKKGKAKPETTKLGQAKKKLTIASYNLENFSNNKASNETPDSKAEKLARAFAKDMKSPDIIGVTEVQDNNGQAAGDSDASESYERLIAAIEKAGGPAYEYVNINPENNKDGGAPNANIRVGFLYNPERVSLTKGPQPGSAAQPVDYKDGKLTYNPGRIDPNNDAFNNSRKPLAAQFDFQGESVIVIANHFNSKSGDTPLFGSTQPPVYGSEAQRHQMAQIVNDFVENIKTENKQANVVVLGDLNDFEFSRTLEILKGNELVNMIDKVKEKERYTYLFQGNSQVLDHILVSNNLAKSTKADIVHINADFTDMAGRASDHDPVLVEIKF